MKPNSEDRRRGHASWIQSMNEAHLTCRQVLKQATVDVSDPGRALWPAVPRRHMTQEHQTVAQCHAAVLDYAEHIEPLKNRCAGLWTERIEPPHQFPEGETFPVVLSEIEQWADRRYKLKVGTRHELTGQRQEIEFRRIHIPTGYARKCFRKLNDCRDQLKLAVDLDNHTFDTENKDPGLKHGR